MKTKKGMTLVEIVISLGIYALLALLLTEIMSVVNSTMKATNQLNNRLSFQAKFADNQVTAGAVRSDGGDPESGAFALDMVYGNVDPSTGNLLTETHIGEDDPGATLTFNEWTAQYNPVDEEGNPRQVLGINYAQDINYKFMTYTYPEEVSESFGGYDFNVEVYLMPYIDDDGSLTAAERNAANEAALEFINNVDSVVIEGQLINDDEGVDNSETPHFRPAEPYVYPAFRDADAATRRRYAWIDTAHGEPYSLREPVRFSILNEADTLDGRDEIWNDGFPVTVRYLDASGREVLAFNVPEVYMYVKRGSTESYYERAALALDLRLAMSSDRADNERAVRVGRSHARTEDYSLADFIRVDDEEEPAPEETPEEPDDEG
ncbi:MAG: type II secretion system protein [Oscillospiraceae bacterium]|nr:type II secretion system protein [Oscillospiraceae bacterium]